MQTAIRESRGGANLGRVSSAAPGLLKSAASGTPRETANERFPSENGALANGSTASGSSTPLLAEGTETALLYVRFRAVAEPGLKGAQ